MKPETETRIRALPCWGALITIEPLHGGLSNESYVVSERAGRFVVRLGQDYPFHHVSRQRELMVARAAHEAGFAPEVIYAEPGVMVSRYLDAKTYTPADVQADIPVIAALVRRFHSQMRAHVSGPGFAFWVFHVIRDYAATLRAGGSRKADALPEYLRISAALEEAQLPLPIIFGHHDFLPANFLHDGSRLWLIDFEYAGFGTAMFDLAGIASNAGFNGDQSDALLEAYFDVPVTPALRKSHAAMQCASLLREAMWSMVSELHLDAPGVDYAAYTDENLDHFARQLEEYQTVYGKH